MSIELKIKAKHLGAEARIIKTEEHKLKARARFLRLNQKPDSKIMSQLHSIQSHRREDVRDEARATHLARAYMKGLKYSDVEQKTFTDEYRMARIKKRVAAMITKYSDSKVDTDKIYKWMES